MKTLKLFGLFLSINFSGLAIGNWLMANGPKTEWYINLNKAPWTPPGAVFGIAWTLIMICFSYYLAKLFTLENTKKNKIIFAIHVVLNVSWNYLFFNQHFVNLGLINLILLTGLLFLYFFKYSKAVKNYKYLLTPYLIWLCIATSLNAYVLIYN